MATQVIAPQSKSFFEGAGFGEGLDQALQTSPEVLSAIYTAHYQHVLQVCRRFFRRPEDAEDAAAEVFLKLHLVLDKKDSEHPLRPWVCQVAGRHCIDKLRRRKRERCSVLARNDLCAVADSCTPSPLSQVLRKEAKRYVREELNRLPDYYKRPLVLRYYKRMSYSEIAQALNRRVPAVKTIIFRAKSRLRRNLVHLDKSKLAPNRGDGTSFSGRVLQRLQPPQLRQPQQYSEQPVVWSIDANVGEQSRRGQ